MCIIINIEPGADQCCASLDTYQILVQVSQQSPVHWSVAREQLARQPAPTEQDEDIGIRPVGSWLQG